MARRILDEVSVLKIDKDCFVGRNWLVDYVGMISVNLSFESQSNRLAPPVYHEYLRFVVGGLVWLVHRNEER